MDRKFIYQEKVKLIRDNIGKVIVGKEEVTDLILTAVIAGGHVLLEDVPGTGKTMTAKSFARSIDADFNRIQFTPDMLPSDVTGINYYNQKQGEFTFKKGLYFPISFWLMKLTGQLQEPSQHYLSVWKKDRLQLTA